MSELPRILRLDERFKLIQRTIEELHGRDMAWAAASAAWLQAIQYAALQSMKQVANCWDAEDEGGAEAARKIIELDAEHEGVLKGFHRELCIHLKIDVEDALELSRQFDQVIKDICLQRG